MANPNRPGYLARATEEFKGIGREGIAHPSAKPLLAGAAIGTVAAILLPVLTIPVGLIGGVGIALWQRIKR